MFHSARLQLTAWYLLIIMIVSILFSLVIYSSINAELVRLENFQQGRQQRLEHVLEDMNLPKPPEPVFSTEEIQHSRERLVLTLLLINMGIIAISGGAGYFLAGKTLQPIQEMMEEQKRFITDASHELRTPLTALRSEIEVSLRDENLSLQDAKTLLESNLEEVVELQTLSDSLITLTRQQARPEILLAKIQLLSVFEGALKKVIPLAKKKHITIDAQVDDMTIIGNRESLTELFVILLDNAIKYSPEKTKITVNSKRAKQFVIVQIIDQGIGIERQEITHIFNRFYRADTARTKSDTSGYGLGLSIAKQIALDHNGDILVRSSPGKGSTFTVKLHGE